MAPNDSYYRQFRSSSQFEWQPSRRGAFKECLLRGDVERFEIAQDCNQSCEYRRCFYKLKHSDTVYQERGLDDPGIRWTDGETSKLNGQHDHTWHFILHNFTLSRSPFHVSFKAKTTLF